MARSLLYTLKSRVLAVVFISLIASGTLVAVVPASSFAAAPKTAADCSQNFLTFPTWFRGLVAIQKDPVTGDNECEIVSPADSGGLSDFVWHIVLNVIEIGLQLVGYISAFFILYGGFLFLTSSGEAAGIAKAKTTITNAVIGLVISLASVAIVNLIFGLVFGKSAV